MSDHRKTKVEETLAHLAMDFLARESSVKALMTVTHAKVGETFKDVTVYFTVLPVSMEAQALKFAKRSRTDFRDYVKKNTFLHPIPVVDFEIDLGEKNRQRIDELTRT